MRILLFLPDLGGGGAQRTIVNLANTFSASGHEAFLCLASSRGPARSWISESVNVVDFAAGRTRNSLFALARFIRATKPDVVLASMIDANIVAWAASRLLGKARPRIVLRETNSQRMRDDLGLLRQGLIRLAYRGADGVVALSEGVRRELIEDLGLPETGVVTIHNPVEHRAIAAAAVRARSAAPPLPKSGPWIVGVGRLLRQKGFERLVRAVAQSTRRDTQLVLVGEGPDRAMLRQLGDELGLGERLAMPGFVDDPVSWLAHADLFVLSSRWEGFGHVIVEAMAAGVPVVAFDCPHGPRDIIEDGVNGLLVPDGDELKLTAAIDRILRDASFARQLAVRAEQDATQFSSERIAQRYLDLFSTLN